MFRIYDLELIVTNYERYNPSARACRGTPAFFIIVITIFYFSAYRYNLAECVIISDRCKNSVELS